MKRAAIYARYSTDLQSDRSIEDQFALCRAYAHREDFAIVDTFEDRAKSGASVFGRDGRHAGGQAYGYRPVSGKPGELAIEPAEADVVREIFERYTAGWVPRQIAADLNARRVPPPRGRYWAAVTINGNRKRGSGIILNPLYAGRIVWNRLRMVKNPDTSRRVSRPNPHSAWQVAEASHLRIVDQETWETVYASSPRTATARSGTPPHSTRWNERSRIFR